MNQGTSLNWPRRETFKTLVNRVIRKFRRILHRPINGKSKYFGYVRKLNFGKDKECNFILPSADIGLSRQLDFSSFREWRSTNYFIKLLSHKNYETIIDLGANLGYFVCIERLHASAKIIAIEPVPFNYNILKANVVLNEFENVNVYNAAVGLANEDVTIYEFDHKNWSTIDASHAESLRELGYQCKENTVKQFEIMSLLEMNVSAGNCLLRMDVEGYEYEILKDLNILKSLHLDIFFEFHTNLLGKKRTITILERLYESGYNSCVIIFNEEFALDNQVMKYHDVNKVQKLSLSTFLEQVKVTAEDEFLENPGFECFISKNDMELYV